jgi:hypothetical protein
MPLSMHGKRRSVLPFDLSCLFSIAFTRRSLLLPTVYSVLCSAFCASPARAHRLIVECHALPGGRVQVEAWFDLTSQSPKDAVVQVLRGDGSLLTRGKLDGKGIFVFTPSEPEPLKVVVTAGADHRAEANISADSLVQLLQHKVNPAADRASSADSAGPLPLSDRSPRVSIKDVLIGVGFLLGLAAFVLSLRNSRRLRELGQSSSPS